MYIMDTYLFKLDKKSIIRIIEAIDDAKSVVSFATTCRYLCRLSIPLIYKNPCLDSNKKLQKFTQAVVNHEGLASYIKELNLICPNHHFSEYYSPLPLGNHLTFFKKLRCMGKLKLLNNTIILDEILTRADEIESLFLYGYNLTYTNAYNWTNRWTELKYLKIVSDYLQYSSLLIIAIKCKQLVKLDLFVTIDVNFNGLKFLFINLINLNEITLSCFTTGNDLIQAILLLKNLKSLRLYDCENLDDESLLRIKDFKFPFLLEFSLIDCKLITNRSFDNLYFFFLNLIYFDFSLNNFKDEEEANNDNSLVLNEENEIVANLKRLYLKNINISNIILPRELNHFILDNCTLHSSLNFNDTHDFDWSFLSNYLYVELLNIKVDINILLSNLSRKHNSNIKLKTIKLKNLMGHINLEVLIRFFIVNSQLNFIYMENIHNLDYIFYYLSESDGEHFTGNVFIDRKKFIFICNKFYSLEHFGPDEIVWKNDTRKEVRVFSIDSINSITSKDSVNSNLSQNQNQNQIKYNKRISKESQVKKMADIDELINLKTLKMSDRKDYFKNKEKENITSDEIFAIFKIRLHSEKNLIKLSVYYNDLPLGKQSVDRFVKEYKIREGLKEKLYVIVYDKIKRKLKGRLPDCDFCF